MFIGEGICCSSGCAGRGVFNAGVDGFRSRVVFGESGLAEPSSDQVRGKYGNGCWKRVVYML